ncbi:MAG: ATP-binding cassette domain-containing protein [Flavipsychrobacter sp.]|nr:ATP-binding cassette domain-containing protein [Flavipsychrobacter sp.]
MSIAIKVENLSKIYHLGEIGTGTLSRDIERWWALLRGKEDPYLKIGETNERTTKSESNIVYSLKDLNFEIKQGDAVGIIGRNGAGKSTLLKILSRVTSPSVGKISAKGRVASLLEVGTGFHPELTGLENIYLNGAILGMQKKEIARKLEEIIDFSGIERYVDTPVKRYSSGMYVRLAFAVAAHLESEILIVDEVLAVGDLEFQNKCLGKMGEVSKGEGRTVLFVSHNMGAIKKLCNQSIVLQNGELYYQGNVQEGVKSYLQSTLQIQENYDASNIMYNSEFDAAITWCEASIIQNGTITTEVHSDESFDVCISYEVKENIVGFRLFIGLENNEELCLFKSFFDEKKHWGTEVAKGKYESVVSIPAHLLMEGRYCIKVYATIHGLRNINPTGGIQLFFDVFQTGYINRLTYSEDFKGMFTLPLEWNSIKL